VLGIRGLKETHFEKLTRIKYGTNPAGNNSDM